MAPRGAIATRGSPAAAPPAASIFKCKRKFIETRKRTRKIRRARAGHTARSPGAGSRTQPQTVNSWNVGRSWLVELGLSTSKVRPLSAGTVFQFPAPGRQNLPPPAERRQIKQGTGPGGIFLSITLDPRHLGGRLARCCQHLSEAVSGWTTLHHFYICTENVLNLH